MMKPTRDPGAQMSDLQMRLWQLFREADHTHPNVAPFTADIIAIIIEALIDDTVWMDAWAEPGTERQRRMSESRKTIIDWLRSHLPDGDA